MYIHRCNERFSVEVAWLVTRVAVLTGTGKVFSATRNSTFSSDGKMLGTVCHFDNMPVRVTEEVATALDGLAPLIAEAAFTATEKM
jgi:hypothetical protein